MKLLTLILLSLFAVACVQEEVQSYNDLTHDEQEAIRRMGSEKCLNDSKKSFEDFTEVTNEKMADFERGDAWKITSKTGTTTTTNYIYVWNKTATAVYFMYKYKVDNVSNYDFIKMPFAVNGHMISDMRFKYCDKATDKTRSISLPRSNISIKFAKIKSTEADIDYETDTTYTSTNQQPIFFTGLNKKIVTRKYKENGSLDTTETTEYTVAAAGDLRDDLRATYNHADYNLKKFCIVNYTVGTTPEQPFLFVFPYFPLNCKTVDNANVNTGASSVFDFTPNTEL